MIASTVPVSAAHMLLHVLMMSAIAPLGIAALRLAAHRMAVPRWLRGRAWHVSPPHLWLATGTQLAVFLYWHSPSAMTHAMHAWSAALLLQVSLLAAAGLFWWCIAGLDRDKAWHAIAALLVTGKTFCLVAVIITFAPRPLYHMMSVEDQQLAGLIMITLCPLTYVASALWLCRRWLLRFEVPARP